MQFVVNICVDNAAFGETSEESSDSVAEILRDLALRVAMEPSSFEDNLRKVWDSNGNAIGVAGFKANVQVVVKE